MPDLSGCPIRILTHIRTVRQESPKGLEAFQILYDRGLRTLKKSAKICVIMPEFKLKPNVVETTFHVRYAETDQMGFVHHAVYPVWLEEGRSQWIRDQGSSYALFEEDGLFLAVSELQLRYCQPARYDQFVKIRTWVAEVKSRQVIFEYEVVRVEDNCLLSNGYTKLVCLDQTGNVVKMPLKWQKLLKHEP